MTCSLSSGKSLKIEDLLQLPRPQAAIVSPSKNLAIWPSSSFSFNAAQGKGRTTQSLYLIHLNDEHKTTDPQLLLTNLTSLETAWVDHRTILFLRPVTPVNRLTLNSEGQREDHPVTLSDKEQSKRLSELTSLQGGEGVELWAKDVTSHSTEEYLVDTFPVPFVLPSLPLSLR